jgi:hypothetical protein
MEKRQVEVECIYPIGLWSYDIPVNDCGICRFSLIEPCITCMNSGKFLCSLSKGKCGHVMHTHCIDKWMAEKHNSCPLDQAKWICEDKNFDPARHPMKKSKFDPNKYKKADSVTSKLDKKAVGKGSKKPPYPKAISKKPMKKKGKPKSYPYGKKAKKFQIPMSDSDDSSDSD